MITIWTAWMQKAEYHLVCVCVCVCMQMWLLFWSCQHQLAEGREAYSLYLDLDLSTFPKSWLDVHVADHPQVLYLLPCSCSFFRSFITPSVTLTRLAYIKTELFPETENHYNFFKNIVLPKDNIYLLCANLCSKYFVLINLSDSHSDLMK